MSAPRMAGTVLVFSVESVRWLATGRDGAHATRQVRNCCEDGVRILRYHFCLRTSEIEAPPLADLSSPSPEPKR